MKSALISIYFGSSPRDRVRAFTLIELLIVIAIIAILSVVVVLVLNPAEILRKGRDSNRLSDLATLNTALSVYAEDVGGSMGSSSVTYVSIPDPTATSTAGTDCSGIGSPFTGGGSFHCAASSTYKKTDGTGWIPLNLKKASFGSPIGSLPVDPTNATSSNEYYMYQTDGTTYKITAFPESQAYLAQTGINVSLFTNGTNLALDGGSWILVPGNSTFGTSNFYVMKYDAACANNGVALMTPTDGNGYKDNNSGASTCNPANGLAPASLSNAIPTVDVNVSSSETYCANIGAHLITNNEWQTIAWNAEGVASNWSGGTVGGVSQYMARGNSDSAQAQQASSDDTNSDYLTGYTDFTHRRTQTLSDGAIVWDVAGNIWEWTNNTTIGTQKPHGNTGAWVEWNTVTYSGSTLSQVTAGPSNAAWTSSYGIGQYYEGAANASTYGFARGGAYFDSFDAGLETLVLNTDPGVQGNYISFRCAR
jgi:prepilin-type N-terminal cleavage/methylation domain-containing protein